MLLLLMGKQWELNFIGFSHPFKRSQPKEGNRKELSFIFTAQTIFPSFSDRKKLFDKKSRNKGANENRQGGKALIRSENLPQKEGLSNVRDVIYYSQTIATSELISTKGFHLAFLIQLPSRKVAQPLTPSNNIPGGTT